MTARKSATSRHSAARCGGYLPRRDTNVPPLELPPISTYQALLDGSGEREISTTMAFVRIQTALLKDKNEGKFIVPIGRMRRAPSAWKACSARSASTRQWGSLYTPQDSEQLMSYKEDRKGQMLEEGINEAGSGVFVDRRRHGLRQPQTDHGALLHLLLDVRLPARGRFHLGRGDIQARGFLLGATAGRTTLAGEGLQHQDGPQPDRGDDGANCPAPTIPHTPTSWPVIIHDGMKKMYVSRKTSSTTLGDE